MVQSKIMSPRLFPVKKRVSVRNTHNLCGSQSTSAAECECAVISATTIINNEKKKKKKKKKVTPVTTNAATDLQRRIFRFGQHQREQ
jgi:hypothetical protein